MNKDNLLKELGFFESELGDALKRGHTGIIGIAQMMYMAHLRTCWKLQMIFQFLTVPMW